MCKGDKVLGYSNGARRVHVSDRTVLANEWSFKQNRLPTFAPSKRFKRRILIIQLSLYFNRENLMYKEKNWNC
jgi:hypothetical protein